MLRSLIMTSLSNYLNSQQITLPKRNIISNERLELIIDTMSLQFKMRSLGYMVIIMYIYSQTVRIPFDIFVYIIMFLYIIIYMKLL